MTIHRHITDSSAGSFEVFDIDLGDTRVQLLSLGAAIRTVEVPDGHGLLGHVHLSLPQPSDYADVSSNPHLGATLGRYANRIAGATFVLDGQRFRLNANSQGNTLHGGAHGFDRQIWDCTVLADDADRAVIEFCMHSPDGDMGFPGAVDASVTYAITHQEITMTYDAVTDAPTVINLSHHGYWNLAGSQSIAGHHLHIPAQRRLVTNDIGIPVAIDDVAETVFDLRSPQTLGPVIDATEGVDSCYLVDGEGMRLMAVLSAPAAGRTLTVSSDAPTVQLYTGNGLHSPFVPFQSVSLETQRPPDAPNQPELGESILRPGEAFHSVTTLTFGVC